MKKLILITALISSGMLMQAQVKDAPFNESGVIIITLENTTIEEGVNEIENLLAKKFIFTEHKKVNDNEAYLVSDEYWLRKVKTLIHAVVYVSFVSEGNNVVVEISGELWYEATGHWSYVQPICYKTNAGSNSGLAFTHLNSAFNDYKRQYRMNR